MEKPYYVHLIAGEGGEQIVSGCGYGQAPQTGHSIRYATSEERDEAFPELASVMAEAQINVEKDRIDRPYGSLVSESHAAKFTESLFVILFEKYFGITLTSDDVRNLAKEAIRTKETIANSAQVCFNKHLETVDAEAQRVEKKSNL